MADQDKDSAQETSHFREKLIRPKQDEAADGRLVTGGTARPEAQRLPPGQRGVKTWPVLDLGVPLAEFAVSDALLATHRKGRAA